MLMALGELHGRNLASALMRSRVHNRTHVRGGKPIRLARPSLGSWTVPMSDNSTDKPEQIVTFAPKGQRPSYGTPVEEAGEAIVAKIQRAAELANETARLAASIAAAPPIAVTGIKRALVAAERNDLRAQLELEAEHQVRAFQSRDASEGMSAFFEKS